MSKKDGNKKSYDMTGRISRREFIKKSVVGGATLAALGSLPTFRAHGKTTIEVWGKSTFVADVNNWLRQKAQEWGEKNNVNVKLSLIPSKQYDTKIMAAVQAGKAPDMAIHGLLLANLAAEGYLIPLDDLIDRIGEEDFFSAKLTQSKYQGHYYGVPFMYEIFWNNVRTDLIQEHDLTIPTNYTELAEVAKELSDPTQNFYGLGFSLGRCADANSHFLGTLYNFGGGWLSCRGIEGLDVFKTNPTYNALHWVKNLYDAGAIPPRGMTDIGNNNAYIQERVAMTLNPPSIVYALKKQGHPLADKTLLSPMPALVELGMESAYVFKSSDNKELCKDLIYHYFVDKEDYRKGYIEAAELYPLPVFKSQAKILGEQYEQGKWQHFSVNPYDTLKNAELYLGNMGAYPLNEGSALATRAHSAYVWGDLVTDVVFQDVPVKKAITQAYNRLEEMAEDLGFPETCPATKTS